MSKLDGKNGDKTRRDVGRRRVVVPAKLGQKRVVEDFRFFRPCRRRCKLGYAAAQKYVEPFRFFILGNGWPQGQPDVVRPDGLQVDATAAALSRFVFATAAAAAAAAAAAFCRSARTRTLAMQRRFLPFRHPGAGGRLDGLDQRPVKRASVLETRRVGDRRVGDKKSETKRSILKKIDKKILAPSRS